jgi:hypothetical protein
MRLVPVRSPWLQVVAVFGGFLIGPWVALQVGRYLVPESELVQTVSVFAFALIFVVGTLLWAGVGIATVVIGFFMNLIRGRLPAAARATDAEALVPPGYRAYLIIGFGAGVTVGVLAGLATELSLFVGTGVWTALGLAYGWLLWVAAHYGYLPFLEP